MSKYRILIVDDNQSFAESVRARFSSHEQVLAADMAFDGRDALEKLKKARYDILLLDLIMPHVDGLGVLEQLKLACPDAPPAVIVVSAMRNESHYHHRWCELLLISCIRREKEAIPDRIVLNASSFFSGKEPCFIKRKA